MKKFNLFKNMSLASKEAGLSSSRKNETIDHFEATFWIIYLGMLVYTVGLIALMVLSTHPL